MVWVCGGARKRGASLSPWDVMEWPEISAFFYEWHNFKHDVLISEYFPFTIFKPKELKPKKAKFDKGGGLYLLSTY